MKLKIGDIFRVDLRQDTVGFFQFIGIDEAQLRSDVIRILAGRYPTDHVPPMQAIMNGRTEFFAHCVISVGVKNGSWEKVGHSDELGSTDILFRSTQDFGRDWIEKSERWEIWKFGEEREFIGALSPEFALADPGFVFPPYEIVYRMENGRYQQKFHT